MTALSRSLKFFTVLPHLVGYHETMCARTSNSGEDCILLAVGNLVEPGEIFLNFGKVSISDTADCLTTGVKTETGT